MRWNDWYDDQVLAKLEREGYPQFYVLNFGGPEDRNHIIVMLCMGRSEHGSYAIFRLAQGRGIRTLGYGLSGIAYSDSKVLLVRRWVEWVHRDVWDCSAPFLTPITEDDLLLYLDLEYKSSLFDKVLKGQPLYSLK